MKDTIQDLLDIELTRNNMENEGLCSDALVSTQYRVGVQRQLLRQFLEESDMSHLIVNLAH